MRQYSQQEIDFIREQYGKLTHAQIAQALGRSRMAVSVKMWHLGLNYKPHTCQIKLTAEQRELLRLNFPHCRNEFCALRIGVSPRTLVRLARDMGLEKTREFVRDCQRYTAAKAKESHLKNGTYPPKGVVNDNLKQGEKYRWKKQL